MKKEIWKLKESHFGLPGWKEAKCPCCNKGTFGFVQGDNGIIVNCESKGNVYIEGLWLPSGICRNPLCEWSKVKIKELWE